MTLRAPLIDQINNITEVIAAAVGAAIPTPAQIKPTPRLITIEPTNETRRVFHQLSFRPLYFPTKIISKNLF
jgi:hypothetical protein